MTQIGCKRFGRFPWEQSRDPMNCNLLNPL